MRTHACVPVCLLLACLSPLYAQQSSDLRAAEQKEAENQIGALEKRLWKGDGNDVSKLEAEDYEVIKHAHRYHRADDEAAAKDVKFGLISMDDIQVRMLRPDVALLTYHATESGTFRGTEVPPSLYFASLWVKRDGEWKNVFLAENLPDAFTETYRPVTPSDLQVEQAITQSANSQSDAERYIRESESRWAEAVANGDVSIVQRILADDYIGVDAGDGHLYDKAEAISFIREHYSEFISNHLNEVKVRFFGNTAIAQGSESWERRTGEPRRGRFVWTDTWVLRNGQWQIVAAEDLVTPPLVGKAANPN